MIPQARAVLAVVCKSSILAQFVLTAVPAWFSVVLALDEHTFSTGLSYEVMAHVMTETHWAFLGFGVVFIAAVAWAYNSQHSMILANMVLAFWHGLIALCLLIANPVGTGTGTYALLALAATLRMIGLANAYSDRG